MMIKITIHKKDFNTAKKKDKSDYFIQTDIIDLLQQMQEDFINDMLLYGEHITITKEI